MKVSRSSLQILKITSEYERQILNLQKKAWIQVALFLLPIIGAIVDKMLEGKDAIEDIDQINKHLTAYLKDYPEDYSKHKQEFDSFLENSKKLKELFAEITSASKSDRTSLAPKIEEYIQVSYKVEELASAVSEYLESMKGWGGKTLDMVKMFGIPMVYSNAIYAQDSIKTLFKHLSMSRPVIQAELAKLKKEALKAQSPTPSTETSSKSVTVTPEIQQQIREVLNSDKPDSAGTVTVTEDIIKQIQQVV